MHSRICMQKKNFIFIVGVPCDLELLGIRYAWVKFAFKGVIAVAERERSIVIHAPIDTVYEVWSRFLDFPNFMKHVKEVAMISPTESHWEVELSGVRFGFDAEITEVDEGRHIAWRSLSGISNSGHVNFDEVPEGTKVTVHVNYMPETYPENLASQFGSIQSIEDQIQEDLDNLRSYIEQKAKAA